METNASEQLRKMGVMVDLGDHRSPESILQSIIANGQINRSSQETHPATPSEQPEV